jgi:hypothetical protein
MHSRYFKTPKIKNMTRHRQINEFREDINKHQSETKDTMRREMYELKMTTQNIKDELNKDRENFSRKNQKEILEIKSLISRTKNTMEGHSNRIEHMKKESQSSKIKQKLKEKEILVKQLKSCERNSATQSKTSNLRIMGTEEEEVQAKGIHNIFNKIRTYNFSNLKKVLPIQVQASSRTPNRLD